MTKPVKPLPWWLHALIVAALAIPVVVAFFDVLVDTSSNAVLAQAGLIFCLIVVGIFALITTWRFPKWRMQPEWALVRYVLAFGASIALTCGGINIAPYFPSPHDREQDLKDERKKQFQHDMVKVERWWHREPSPTEVVLGVEVTAGTDCRFLVSMVTWYTDDAETDPKLRESGLRQDTDFKDAKKGQRLIIERLIQLPPATHPAGHYSVSFGCNDTSIVYEDPAPADQGLSGDAPHVPFP